ncbi:AUGMIN subunit 5-like [Mizuhopecten yessoensis]|uniref:HAUS augmin-like complex subunit 5 n=1 Tax=Mizuhopecten yessoensis TaxID=6573 RepID=A0A210PDU6_MIZYE|nr:AUGMIN subunit 5-like [Mizuhopecten yessoensis]XP_021344035.1 AUGMIN subunit 5-like [Mizuhopecten yessoensis]OWF34653.1 HAUS augmin-like complex subunit 5 [Mizuhopecten yessoensis]
MTSNRRDDVDLAVMLHKWAMEEMRYRPQGVGVRQPNVDEFKDICRGQMKDIWKFVTSHVYSAQTVKEVQGNLTLKGRKKRTYKVRFKSDEKYDSQRQTLLDRRARLAGEATNIITDLSHLENDLRRQQQELADTQRTYVLACSALTGLQRKSALLQTFNQQGQNTSHMYEEYCRRINSRIQHVTSRAKKASESDEYYSRKHSSTDEDHYSNMPALETRCSKKVRETCDSVGLFLNTLLQGAFDTEKTAIQRKKELLWSEVETVLREFSVQQTFSSLLVNTQESSFSLRDKTSSIDLRKDAERLRFKYEKPGEMTNLSSPPSLLQSVHQLLEESQLKQIQRFIETQKHENETWSLDDQLNNVRQKIENQLQKNFKQTESLKKARLLVEYELELSGKRAALTCCIDEDETLKERIVKSLRDKDMLVAKYQKIQDFRQIADKKQNLIRVLIKQNANAKSRLDEQQREIQQYIQRSLLSHQIETKSLTNGLHGCMISEMDKFVGLTLPCLLFSKQTDSPFKVAVMDMSINQTTNLVAIASRQALHDVFSCLQFPAYLAPELIMSHCLEEKLKSKNISAQLDHHDKMLHHFGRRTGDKDVVEVIIDLCKDISEHDRKQLDKLLPVLQDRIEKSQKCLAGASSTKQTVQDWWEQPAQSTVPWVLVDQHNLQQWRNRWNVVVTKLRQAMLQNMDQSKK